MAEVSLKISAEFAQAQSEFKKLGNVSEEARAEIEKFRKSFDPKEIDMFMARNKMMAIAVQATKGDLAGAKAEVKGLEKEMQKLISQGLDPTSKEFEKLAGSLTNAREKFSKLDAEAKKIKFDGMQSSSVKANSSMMDMAKTVQLAANVLAGSMIANKIYDIGKASLMAASDMQQNQIAFKTMLQSAEAATDILNQITQFAAKTPFNKNELIGYAKGMIGVGFATKDIIPTMEMLGNIAAGVGQEKLPNIVKAFDKMKAKGKASLEELWPIVEAGVPILEQLAKDLGKSKDEVIKMATNGKLGFEQVQSSLKKVELEKFNGLMNELTVTFGGKLSNFNDQLDMTAVIIGNKMMPTANTWLDLASNILSTLNESGDETESAFGKTLDYVTAVYNPVKGIAMSYTWIAEKANEYLFTTDKQVAATWQMNKAIETHKENVLAIAQAYIDANKAQGGGKTPTVKTGGGGGKKSESQMMQDDLVILKNVEAQAYADRLKSAEEFFVQKAELEKVSTSDLMAWQFEQASLIASNEKLSYDQKLAAMKALDKAVQKSAETQTKTQLQFGTNIIGATSDLLTNIQTVMKNSGKESRTLAIAMKGLAMAQAGINAALAITKTLADGGPFPLNVINAAIIGAAGAAQIAAIATTPIPKAETGLSNYTVPDIRSNRNDGAAVMAQAGETVSVSPRGENDNSLTNINIAVSEQTIFSIVAKGIKTGQIDLNNNNIGRGVFAN